MPVLIYGCSYKCYVMMMVTMPEYIMGPLWQRMPDFTCRILHAGVTPACVFPHRIFHFSRTERRDVFIY